MKFNQLAADIAAVKNEIITKGWCQHTPQNAAGEVCLLGSLRVLNSDPQRMREARGVISFQIMLQGYPAYLDLWNDKLGRTVEQVYNMLDKCITQAFVS